MEVKLNHYNFTIVRDIFVNNLILYKNVLRLNMSNFSLFCYLFVKLFEHPYQGTAGFE